MKNVILLLSIWLLTSCKSNSQKVAPMQFKDHGYTYNLTPKYESAGQTYVIAITLVGRKQELYVNYYGYSALSTYRREGMNGFTKQGYEYWKILFGGNYLESAVFTSKEDVEEFLKILKLLEARSNEHENRMIAEENARRKRLEEKMKRQKDYQ